MAIPFTLDILSGPDAKKQGEVDIWRLVEGTDAESGAYVLPERQRVSILDKTGAFTVLDLDANVTYLFDIRRVGNKSIGAGVRAKTMPASGAAKFSTTPDVTPIYPSAGILGDALVTGLANNSDSDFRAKLEELFALSEGGTLADGALALLLGNPASESSALVDAKIGAAVEDPGPARDGIDARADGRVLAGVSDRTTPVYAALLSGILAGQVNLASYANLAVGGDWSPALTQALADANIGDGRYRKILVPNLGATYQFTSGFTLPSFQIIEGLGKPKLSWSTAADGITALTLGGAAELRSLSLTGASKTGTQIAVKFNGSHQKVRDCRIDLWGTALDFVNNNTYITTVESCQVQDCGLGVDMRNGSVTNSGEKMAFVDTTFGTCAKIFHLSSSVIDSFWDRCSFDYSTDFGELSNGQHYFTNCHFETNSTTTTQGYLFRKTNGATVRFIGTRIGMQGISLIVDRATEGTSGSISYANCRAAFTTTAAVYTSRDSEQQVVINAGTATTTLDSPFISRTVLGSVQMAFHSGNPARAIALPTVDFAASSTLGTVTLAANAPSNTVVQVRFG